MKWKEEQSEKPNGSLEVYAYSEEWIDLDYNPDGIRVASYLEDCDTWISAKWSGCADGYVSDEESKPTHWLYKNTRNSIGVFYIANEREEQIVKHGITIEMDLECNRFNQLVDGAMSLLKSKPTIHDIPSFWSEEKWNKMIAKPYKDRIIIAGALLAADLDIQELEEKKLREQAERV